MKDYRRLPNCCRVSGKREKNGCWYTSFHPSYLIIDENTKSFTRKGLKWDNFAAFTSLFNWKTNAKCRRNVSIIPATFAQFTAITLNRLLGNGVSVNNLINLP